MVENTRNLSAQQKRALLKRLLAKQAPQPKYAPLSFAQERLWFLAQLEPDSLLFCETSASQLKAPLDGELATKVLNEVVRRHEILRTTFPTKEGRPVQRIAPFAASRVRVIDLGAVRESRRDEVVRELAREQSRIALDLVRGPLLRATLVQLDDSDSVLIVSMHHIIHDGWSVGVLLREIVLLYGAFRDGKASPLPELPIQYADFARWERERMEKGLLDNQLSYWRSQLAGAPVLELSTDRPRPKIQSRHGATFRFELPPRLHLALRDLCRVEKCTLFMTLLTALQMLLSRYSGQEELVVGSSVAARNRSELEPLIGFFVNMLAMRVDLSGDPSFREALARVRDVALEAYAHDEVPFPKLIKELQLGRDLSREPLFQVVLNVDRNYMEIPAIAGIRCAPLPIESGSTKYDLSFYLWHDAERAYGFVEYSVALFDVTTIHRLVGHYLTFLETVVAKPESKLASVQFLSAGERQQLLSEWNDPQVVKPEMPCAHVLFDAQAQRTPDAVAVVDGSRTLSYGELNARANRLGYHLRSLGIGPETPVAIFLHRSMEMILGILGALKAGGAYVPLDPAQPDHRLHFMLEDTSATVVLTENKLMSRLPAQARTLCLDSAWEAREPASPAAPAPGMSEANLAYVIYTSGSTGRPKGVALTHGGLNNLIDWHRRQYGVQCVDRATQLASPGFDASVWELWPYLSAGASVHIADEVTRTSPSSLVEWLASEAVTITFLPTPLAESALEERWPHEVCLRTMLTGGDRLHAGAPEQLPFALVNHYGPTENTVVTTSCNVGEGKPAQAAPPIGRPLPNVQALVLDRHLNPVPASVPGELHAGGASLARGYFRRPALTAKHFIPDPFTAVPGARLYRTGDLVRLLADGNIEFLGRIDHQVKVRGFRIELGEIECAVTEYPGVREAAVVAQEGSNHQTRLVAYVVPQRMTVDAASSGGEAPYSELVAGLRSFVSERLPNHMLPASFVVLQALPLSANGKVNRAALPAPEDGRIVREREYVAPRTPLEKKLARLWSELLGVERVGVHDDFFELGGHSLLATQLVSRVREQFEVELPLSELFRASTFSGMTEAIERTEPGLSAPPIEPVGRGGELPLSFAQQRLWFLDQLVPGNPFYNVATAVELQGPLAVAILRRSLGETIRRHEVLRTTFTAKDGRAIQRIAAPFALPLPVIDLSGISESRSRDETHRLAHAEAEHPFELATGPLIRAALVRLGAEEHVLLLTIHHIVADGWSLGVFVREAAALYEAFLHGAPSPLTELTVQYADFAHWQRQWLQGDVLERQLTYWRDVLADLPPLELPTDRPRPTVQSYRGATLHFSLHQSLSRAVRELTKSEGVTLFMTLLAAFQALLFRYTAQEDIVLGSGIANRNRGEVEGLIGFFVNMLVLRIDMSGDPTFRELLGRVREVCLSAYAHQDLPFEKLVDELAPERDLSREPLFQVVFELQNFPWQTLTYPNGLRLRPMEIEGRTAKFDLSLYLWEDSERLSGYFEYATDLFDSATIERMLGHYQTVLRVVAARPEQRLSELPLVSESEQRRLLDWGRKKRPLVAAPASHSTTREASGPTALDYDVEEGVL